MKYVTDQNGLIVFVGKRLNRGKFKGAYNLLHLITTGGFESFLLDNEKGQISILPSGEIMLTKSPLWKNPLYIPLNASLFG